jgi:hypothetical protein
MLFGERNWVRGVREGYLLASVCLGYCWQRFWCFAFFSLLKVATIGFQLGAVVMTEPFGAFERIYGVCVCVWIIFLDYSRRIRLRIRNELKTIICSAASKTLSRTDNNNESRQTLPYKI